MDAMPVNTHHFPISSGVPCMLANKVNGMEKKVSDAIIDKQYCMKKNLSAQNVVKKKFVNYKSIMNIDHIDINLLSHVKFAHIFISHLVLQHGFKMFTLNSTTKKPLFQIEYQLPQYFEFYNKKQSKILGSTNQIVHTLQKCVQSSHVIFDHCASFMVEINNESVHYLNKTQLCFKMDIKSISGKHKSTKSTGNCSLAIKHVLQNPGLNLVQSLVVKDVKNGNCLGQLVICLELSSENKGSFEQSLIKNCVNDKNSSLSGVKINMNHYDVAVKQQQPQQAAHKTLKQGISQMKSFLIYSFIAVVKARELSFSSHDDVNMLLSTSSCVISQKHVIKNFYVVSKMFWCTDSAISNIIWTSSFSSINFFHIAPLRLTETLLERLKCNYIVLEVWSKQEKGGDERLIGLIKLSLHQFFLSYHEPDMAQALLQAERAVISCDRWVAVKCPFNDENCGELLVTFAMGSSSQIASLRMAKEIACQPHNHHREEVSGKASNGSMTSEYNTRIVSEHSFEIIIQGIRELRLPDGYVWGDADVFVEYQFPSVIHGSVDDEMELKKFRTACTMAIPQCTVRHRTCHRLSLLSDIPLQNRLTAACATGLPVQLWMRHYLPNVRDECIGKGSIPLEKLCALVCMNQGKTATSAAQRISISLFSNQIGQQNVAATLDMTLTYSLHQGALLSSSRQAAAPIKVIEMSKNQCTLCVNVLRATGLKMAALCASTQISNVQERSAVEYAAAIGVNAYCRFRLSFQRTVERRTLPVVRSFSPEWAHCSQLSLALLWPALDGALELICLAELLEKGNLEVQVWHQSSAVKARQLGPYHHADRLIECARTFDDTLLGTLTLSLSKLLCRPFFRGWFPLRQIPLDDMKCDDFGTRCVGGVELLLCWEQPHDYEKLRQSANLTGYTSLDGEMQTEMDETSSSSYRNITVTLKSLDVAESLCLRCGQQSFSSDSRVYLCYNMYDQVNGGGSTMTKTIKTEAYTAFVNDDARVQINCFHRRSFHFKNCASLYQWLLQSHLEVQVWLQQQAPQHQSDILIGSAYLQLSARTHHRISGSFALLRPQCDSFADSKLRVTLSICPLEASLLDEQEGQAAEHVNSFSSLQPTRQCLAATLTIPLHVLVDEAVRLELLTTPFEAVQLQRYYVTLDTVQCDCETGQFVTPLRSARIGAHGHGCVTWLWERQIFVDKEMLLHCKEKSLYFRVWQQQFDSSTTNISSKFVEEQQHSAYPLPQDHLLGISIVDIAPLMAGLHQLIGWYHIINSRDDIVGQLKLGVTPIKSGDLEQINKLSCPTKKSSIVSTNQNESLLASRRNLFDHLADLDILNKRLTSRISSFETVKEKKMFDRWKENDDDDVLRQAYQLLDASE